MKIADLVDILLKYETLAAREWVAEAERQEVQWCDVPLPSGLNDTELAIAAGAVEMLAERAGQQPPPWAHGVQPSSRRVYLVRAAASMQRLRTLCETEGPEPLRKRHIFAPPEFLTIA